MRHLNEYQHHLRVLLEPYDAKVSRTVLRGESPSNGADLLDLPEIYILCKKKESHIYQQAKPLSVYFLKGLYLHRGCKLNCVSKE